MLIIIAYLVSRSQEVYPNDDDLSGKAISWTPEYGFSVKKSQRTLNNYPRATLGTGNNMGMA